MVSQSFDELENAHKVDQDAIATRMRECEIAVPNPGDDILQDTSAEKTCTSPFSRYLVQTQSHLTQDQARDRTGIHSEPIGSPTPATTNYATKADLLAFERKLNIPGD